MTFQPGQRVLNIRDNSKADVLRVSKDGKRLYIECWSCGSRPKLMRFWQYASAFRPVA